MPEQSRTLEIVTRVRDFASRHFKTMGRTFARVVKFSFLAPLKLLRIGFRAAKAAVVGFASVGVAAFGLFAGGRTARNIIDSADAMSKLARATGTTTEAMSTLETTFALGGIEAERFRAIMLGVGRSISQTLRTGGAQESAFAALGISREDLQRGDFGSLFQQIARGLQQFNTEAEQAAVLQALFPDNFQKLIPLLGQGEAAFLANAHAASQFGAALSTEAGEAAEAFNDELLKLRTALHDVARSGVVGLATELRPVVSAMAEWVRLNKGALIASLQALLRMLIDLGVWVGGALLDAIIFFSRGISGLVADLRKAAEAAGILAGPILNLLADALEKVFGESLSAEARQIQAAMDVVAMSILEVEREIQQLGSSAPEELHTRLAEMNAELDEMAFKFDAVKVKAVELDSEAGTAVFGDGGRRSVPRSGEGQRSRDRAALNELRSRLGALPEFLTGGDSTGGDALARGDGEAGNVFGNMERQADNFFTRFVDGVKAGSTAWRNWADAGVEAGRSILDTGLNAISDGLTSVILGTKSGSEAFKDFAKTILAEVARIIPRLLIIRALSSVFGGAGGGGGGVALARGGITPAVSNVIPFKAFAKGGIADRPTFALFGEGGDEAFVPLQQGRIPVRISGGGGTVINFSPQITAMDGADVRRVLVKERHTLMSIWANGLEHNRAVRETMRGAS